MAKNTKIINAARKVIDTAGGQVQLAREILSRRKIKLTDENLLRMQKRVQKWTKNGVPVDFVLDCEAITSIPRQKIRPDYANLFGEVA